MSCVFWWLIKYLICNEYVLRIRLSQLLQKVPCRTVTCSERIKSYCSPIFMEAISDGIRMRDEIFVDRSHETWGPYGLMTCILIKVWLSLGHLSIRSPRRLNILLKNDWRSAFWSTYWIRSKIDFQSTIQLEVVLSSLPRFEE